MAVSDEAAGGHDPNPDWPDIRREYETTTISHRKLAQRRNVPYTTLSRRAFTEHWSQRARIVRQAVRNLESQLPNQLLASAQKEMAPWIEEKKSEFTKEGFTVAKSGVDRVKKLFKANPKPDPKSESFIAKAFETYHRAGRTALGMGDGSAPGGSINLSILTGQAAVQVNTNPSQD